MEIYIQHPNELGIYFTKQNKTLYTEGRTYNHRRYHLLGDYDEHCQKFEYWKLVIKAILKTVFTLSLAALFSSEVRKNFRGCRSVRVFVPNKNQVDPKLNPGDPKKLPTQEISKKDKAVLKMKTDPVSTKENYVLVSGQEYPFRIKIFQETLLACQNSYQLKQTNYSSIIKIDNNPMLAGTESYNQIDPLPPMIQPYKTTFNVEIDDTFNVLIKRVNEGKNPVGINMANRYKAGGGVDIGCPAQEEALCRRSNHILGLQKEFYPLAEFGGIYTPDVMIMREDEAHGCRFLTDPKKVALVAVAAYDLREKSSDRRSLKLRLDGPISSDALQKSDLYIKGMKEKIRNMLRIMAKKGHTEIVLGALGCGAFQNPPQVVAEMLQTIFKENEFNGRFKQIDFAILKIFRNDQANVDAFTSICKDLNQ